MEDKNKNKNKKKKKIMPLNAYRVSNSLQTYKGETTFLGKKLIDIGIGNIEETIDESSGNKKLVSRVNGTRIKELLGLSENNKSIYEKMKELLDPNMKFDKKTGKPLPKIMQWQVYYCDEEKRRLATSNVITDTKYDDGSMIIEWNYNLRKYLMLLNGEYKGAFTTYSYELTTKKIKSEPAYDLYKEMKKQIDRAYAIYGDLDEAYETEIDIIDLKILLGKVDPDTNAKISEAYNDLTRKTISVIDELDDRKLAEYLVKAPEFNRSVLKPAIKEINEKTDIIIEFKQIRSGRGGKTVAYRFYITYKEKKEIDDAEKERTEFLEKLEKLLVFERGQKPSTTDIESIAEAGDYDLERITYAYNQTIGPHTTPIQNVVTYMIGILKKTPEVPKDPIRQSAKNGFHNFDERDYSKEELDEMERKLLRKSRER